MLATAGQTAGPNLAESLWGIKEAKNIKFIFSKFNFF